MCVHSGKIGAHISEHKYMRCRDTHSMTLYLSLTQIVIFLVELASTSVTANGSLQQMGNNRGIE
jgi:hypothetical protein